MRIPPLLAAVALGPWAALPAGAQQPDTAVVSRRPGRAAAAPPAAGRFLASVVGATAGSGAGLALGWTVGAAVNTGEDTPTQMQLAAGLVGSTLGSALGVSVARRVQGRSAPGAHLAAAAGVLGGAAGTTLGYFLGSRERGVLVCFSVGQGVVTASVESLFARGVDNPRPR